MQSKKCGNATTGCKILRPDTAPQKRVSQLALVLGIDKTPLTELDQAGISLLCVSVLLLARRGESLMVHHFPLIFFKEVGQGKRERTKWIHRWMLIHPVPCCSIISGF